MEVAAYLGGGYLAVLIVVVSFCRVAARAPWWETTGDDIEALSHRRR